MRRLAALLLLATGLLPAQPPRRTPAQRPKPKLLLAIVVDQLRYDYLTRFVQEYNAGFARLLNQGAVFTDAHYEHFPTVTAVGHSTVLSGAYPAVSGIVGNEWFDRESGVQVTSVTDSSVQPLGAPTGKKSSPRRLLVSTVADELKMSGAGESKSIGISLKDRSAILPVGRSADGAYWFDENSGYFVSSTYYFADVPAWVKDFNQSRFTERYLGKEWAPIAGGKPFIRMDPAPGSAFFKAFERSAFGNELLEAFAERAIDAEQLGRHSGTDVLAVSFSSNDYVGHDHGQDSPLVRDISVRTDRILGALFEFVDARVGLDKTLVVLTADHGVAPMPEAQQSRRMPGGRIPEDTVLKKAQAACEAAFGAGKWVVGESGPSPYLNLDLIREKGLRVADVVETAAAAVRSIPHVARVYTRSQLLAGAVNSDPVSRRVAGGFHPQRSANLLVVSEPYWMFEDKGTSHGTPYHYDSHVPVLFLGPGIKPGRYRRRAAVNDIAPTIAAILDIEAPAGSAGRVLVEALD